jgi:copper resistance protein B
MPNTDHMQHTDHSQHGQQSSDALPSADDHSAMADATQSEREHVPPDPPQREVMPMPYRQMAAMMTMDDRGHVGKVMLDRLDWRDANGGALLEWDGAAWYGGDYNKLWFKSEGERRDGRTEDVRCELLWDRVFSRWWSVQAGLRQDSGAGPSRTWAAFGVQGLAPYFFQVEATAYIGDGGRTAARVSSEYDLLLTQRLVLQPEAEINLYGKDDPERGIGSGVSDLQVGLRLRYEIRREFAPYVGVVWSRRFGRSADFARAAGDDPNDLQLLAGLRIWF